MSGFVSELPISKNRREELDPNVLTVALLDDDRAIVDLLRHALQQQGYRVVSAATVAEARTLLSSASWDLFICDRQLPDGDGLTLCADLKKDYASLTRYVMLLTAMSSPVEKIAGFDRGADDYVTKPFQLPELLARVRAGLRIVELQKELIRTNKTLERISTTDALTDVANRRQLETELTRAFSRARRYERPLSLLMIDVDHFKRINDDEGHLIGDDVLREVARRARGVIRESDVIGRFGGEEFAVILPETNLLEALRCGDKLRAAIAATPVVTSSGKHPVTVSVGAASMPHSTFPSERQMVAAADKALYRAKRNGRNRVEMERRSDPSRPTGGTYTGRSGARAATA